MFIPPKGTLVEIPQILMMNCFVLLFFVWKQIKKSQKSKFEKYLIPRKKCYVLRSNLMRLYSPVDLTDNLIMIEKLVLGGA